MQNLQKISPFHRLIPWKTLYKFKILAFILGETHDLIFMIFLKKIFRMNWLSHILLLRGIKIKIKSTLSLNFINNSTKILLNSNGFGETFEFTAPTFVIDRSSPLQMKRFDFRLNIYKEYFRVSSLIYFLVLFYF